MLSEPGFAALPDGLHERRGVAANLVAANQEVSMMSIIGEDECGCTLLHLFEEKNITVDAIRKELGLKSKQSVYRWFYGAALPTVDHLYTLACMLQVPVDELLVLTTETLSDERVMEIINWCN